MIEFRCLECGHETRRRHPKPPTCKMCKEKMVRKFKRRGEEE